MSRTNRKLTIESLSNGIPAIPKDAVAFYKHNCMVCFHHNGHKRGVRLIVNYDGKDHIYEVNWKGYITKRLLNAYKEKKRATDFAACTLSLILVRELTEYTAIEQSCIGTTIDYYLKLKKQDGDMIFNYSARLEVSEILTETEDNTIEGRINQKIKRLKPEGELPDLISVVEFGKPSSKMVKA